MPPFPPPSSYEDPAIDAAHLLFRLGVVILALLVPCAAVYTRGLIFSLMPIGSVLILLSIALMPSEGQHPSWRQLLLQPLTLTLLCLIGWTLLSLLWTPFWLSGTERAFKLSGTIILAFLVAAFLPQRTKISTLYFLPLGTGIACILILISSIFYFDLTPLVSSDLPAPQRAVVGLIMLGWPALAALAKRERWASVGILALGIISAAISLWSLVPLLSIAIGAAVYAMAHSNLQRTGKILGVLCAALLLFFPLLLLFLGMSATHLGFQSYKIAQILIAYAYFIQEEGIRLLTGHGFDTFQRIISFGIFPIVPSRSFLFEIWYELGIVGALSGAVGMGYAYFYAISAPQPVAPFLLASLTSGFFLAVSGLVTTQLWWVTLLGVAGIHFALVLKSVARRARPHLFMKDSNRV